MSYYVQSVYLVQSISIMNLSSLSLKPYVSSESRMSHSSLIAIATHSTQYAAPAKQTASLPFSQ